MFKNELLISVFLIPVTGPPISTHGAGYTHGLRQVDYPQLLPGYEEGSIRQDQQIMWNTHSLGHYAHELVQPKYVCYPGVIANR